MFAKHCRPRTQLASSTEAGLKREKQFRKFLTPVNYGGSHDYASSNFRAWFKGGETSKGVSPVKVYAKPRIRGKIAQYGRPQTVGPLRGYPNRNSDGN